MKALFVSGYEIDGVKGSHEVIEGSNTALIVPRFKFGTLYTGRVDLEASFSEYEEEDLVIPEEWRDAYAVVAYLPESRFAKPVKMRRGTTVYLDVLWGRIVNRLNYANARAFNLVCGHLNSVKVEARMSTYIQSPVLQVECGGYLTMKCCIKAFLSEGLEGLCAMLEIQKSLRYSPPSERR